MFNFKSKILANQFRKPSGLLGRFISRIMEKYNIYIYDVIIDEINKIDTEQKILEIGYGPGLGLNKLLTQNKKVIFHGIDFSKLMYKRAAKLNKHHIRKNRLNLIHGDLKEHNFNDEKYRVIFSINVVYFWKSLDEYFKKIYNLLNKNSLFILFFVIPEDLIKIKLTQTDVFYKYEKNEIINRLKNNGFKKFDLKEDTTEGSRGNYIFAYN
jgi:cyclopropane fatty-acyl-phospholipid synthase-like methyltransferase